MVFTCRGYRNYELPKNARRGAGKITSITEQGPRSRDQEAASDLDPVAADQNIADFAKFTATDAH